MLRITYESVTCGNKHIIITTKIFTVIHFFQSYQAPHNDNFFEAIFFFEKVTMTLEGVSLK